MLVLRHGERCVEGHLQLVVMVAVEARREHSRHLDPGHDLRSHRNQLFDGKTHTHRLTCLRRQRIEVDAQLPQCGSRNLRMVVLHPFELHRIHTMIVQRLQPLLVVGVLRQAKQVVDHVLHGVEGYFQKLEVDGFVRLRLEAADEGRHRTALRDLEKRRRVLCQWLHGMHLVTVAAFAQVRNDLHLARSGMARQKRLFVVGPPRLLRRLILFLFHND